MSFESKVYRILIATPSDVEEERDIITKAIQSWNDLNAYSKKTVLLPLRWETHIAPDYGERPQEIINRAIVDDCDLLIGCFWTRIGSPTGKEESGTLEEIKTVANSGKPIMLYFSKRGQDPSLIDIDQLQKLNDFKALLKQKAFIEEYSNSIDFRDKLTRQIELKIREIQKKQKDNTVQTKVSFVSIETKSLLPSTLKVKHEIPIINNEETEKIILSKQEYRVNKNKIISEVNNQLLKYSTFPLVFGIENYSMFNLNNLVIDIKIPRDDQKYFIRADKQRGAFGFYYSAGKSEISDDLWNKLSKLDNDGLLNSDANFYSLSFTETSVQKKRLTINKPYLFLSVKESCNIDFNISLYAESLLEPQQMKCSMEIEVSKATARFSDLIPNIDEFLRNSDIF